MVSRSDECVSRSLRSVLAELPVGADIGESEQFRDVLSGLERFLPQVLEEIHAEWKWESLDGIFPSLAHKTGEGEAEIFGLCILISDQTAAPLHVQLQIADAADEVSWLECRLGERGRNGMNRVPYESRDKLSNRLRLLAEKKDQVDWAYHVTYGERRR